MPEIQTKPSVGSLPPQTHGVEHEDGAHDERSGDDTVAHKEISSSLRAVGQQRRPKSLLCGIRPSAPVARPGPLQAVEGLSDCVGHRFAAAARNEDPPHHAGVSRTHEHAHPPEHLVIGQYSDWRGQGTLAR